MTSSLVREYRYRRLYPGITHEQYLATSLNDVDWTLRIAELHGDRPWQQRGGEPGADSGTS